MVVGADLYAYINITRMGSIRGIRYKGLSTYIAYSTPARTARNSPLASTSRFISSQTEAGSKIAAILGIPAMT